MSDLGERSEPGSSTKSLKSGILFGCRTEFGCLGTRKKRNGSRILFGVQGAFSTSVASDLGESSEP